ncbi:hypothetical protein DMC47_43720 [Nostoc sp. 3335mG]|nr:hypothetical protein DMC47_43720 [Nostoc sp. 3335mG]
MIANLLRRWTGGRETKSLTPERRALFGAEHPELFSDEAAAERRAIFDAARALPDGAPCDERLLAAVRAEAHARRVATGTSEGPPLPHCTNLRIRHSGLPDWWHEGGNLALAAPSSGPQEFEVGPMISVPRNGIAVFGDGVSFQTARLIGDNALLILGDQVKLAYSMIVIGTNTTVMIGEESSATWMCSIDARNGGMVIIGPDAMFASGVWVITDDTHAIRDIATNKRINRYGGRIVVDRHVWACDQVRLTGDCTVGADSVIGAGSFVKNTALPPQAVCVGRPARPVRTGITWNRFDEP